MSTPPHPPVSRIKRDAWSKDRFACKVRKQSKEQNKFVSCNENEALLFRESG